MAKQPFSGSNFKNKRSQKGYPPKKGPKQPNNNWMFWVALSFIFLIFMSQSTTMTSVKAPREIAYSEFYSILQNNKETSQIEHLELIESTENTLQGTFDDETQFKVVIPQNYDDSLIELIEKCDRIITW
jgi:hypothetical protein